MSAPVRFLRMPDVCARRGRSRPVLYRDVARGVFPEPIRRGPKCSLWIEVEVDTVLAAEAAGASDEELRQLVKDLVAGRRDRARAVAPAAKEPAHA